MFGVWRFSGFGARVLSFGLLGFRYFFLSALCREKHTGFAIRSKKAFRGVGSPGGLGFRVVWAFVHFPRWGVWKGFRLGALGFGPLRCRISGLGHWALTGGLPGFFGGL